MEVQDLEKKANIFMNRPPNIWNDPESLEKHHFTRYSAKPLDNKIYEDGRVAELYEFIIELANVLHDSDPAKWENLVQKTVDVYRDLDKRYPQEENEE